MTLLGKWRITEMPDYEDDYPDMMEPAYILFGSEHGEFAFGCVTGAFASAATTTPSRSAGMATTKWTRRAATDGPNFSPTAPLRGAICFHGGDEANFTRWPGNFFNSLLGRRAASSLAGASAPDLIRGTKARTVPAGLVSSP